MSSQYVSVYEEVKNDDGQYYNISQLLLPVIEKKVLIKYQAYSIFIKYDVLLGNNEIN